MDEDPCSSARETLRVAVEKLSRVSMPSVVDEANPDAPKPEYEGALQLMEQAQQELIQADAALAECEAKHGLNTAAESKD